MNPLRHLLPAAAFLLALLAACTTTGSDTNAGTPLTVAISPDIPPYVIDDARGGFEVELLRRALPGRKLRFVQIPYGELQTAVPSGRADVSVGVQHFKDDGVHYSRDFVTFTNVAAAHTAAGLAIDSVADLAGHRVLTWQDAYLELGPEFEALFAPGAPHHGDYVEVADQTEQVREFWADPESIVVIDRNILDALSRAAGHDLSELTAHELFPPVTDFKVAFADPALRDAFDRGLERLCGSGEYGRLSEKNRVEVPMNVCER